MPDKKGRRSIARKLLVMALASVFTATATASGASLWNALERYVEGREDTLRATAHVFAASVAPAVATQDRQAAARVLSAIARVPDLAYARVETTDGARFAEIGAAVSLVGDGRLDETRESLGVYRMLSSRTVETSAPIMSGGSPIGRLVLVARTPDMHAETLAIISNALIACGVATTLALMIAGRLQRSIARPIQELADAVARIRSSQRYDARVDAQSDDEVGLLIDAFNEMIADVKERDLKIEAQLRNLEDQVSKRTEDLRLAKTTAEEASSAKTQFLATMSHEIRTPMHGVLVMAELLAGADLPERQRRYADVIVQSGKTLLALINDLLDLSKIEAGKLELERDRVDLTEIVGQVATLFWARARSKSLDLAAFVAPGTPVAVLGDPVRVNQIVANLVGNALKFTDRGFVYVSVAPDPQRADRIVLSVRDSGIGIPKDKLIGIFGEFTQADQSTTRTHGGSGLGLAICRKLAHAMGGEIKVASEVGKGSLFQAELILPTSEYAPEWPRAKRALSVHIDTALPATRRALSEYFAAAGFEIVPRDSEAARLANVLIADADRAAHAPAAPDAWRIALRGIDRADIDRIEVDAHLTLPLAQRDVEQLIVGLARGELSPAAFTHRTPAPVERFDGARALVVDDNEVNREVALEALSRFGIEAETAHTGVEAVSKTQAQRFDIVFMDGSMPEMDGFEATRRIRAREQATGAQRVPIVALTADVLGASQSAWRDAGADALLHKPFAMHALAQELSLRLARPAQQTTGAQPALEAAAADDPVDALSTLGAPAFVERVAQLYIEQAPQRMQALAAAAAAGDWEEVARMAHAIKSMSLSLKLDQAARAASDVERRIRGDGLPATPAEIGKLSAVLAALVDRIASRYGGKRGAPETDEGLGAALSDALRDDTLELYYQPIVDRAGERVLGFEGLVRWRRSDVALIGAQAIMACAEANGLVTRLGEWAIARACRDARAFPSPVFVAVNVSPTQLRDHQFGARVLRALRDHDVPPSRLVLEITEQSTLSGEQRVVDLVKTLRAQGVKIALDDFGTGYSSLTHLRRFPIDKLKIDQSFVADISTSVDAAAIVHAVAGIARTLGISLVAEGVETPEQHVFLKAAGVHAMQGYLFGRPMPIEEAERFALARPPLFAAAS